ncbi:MAG: thiamine diphosphokinase [Chloroflexi bacterium]|nr:thiamine diphosphokinase [Ardenticatenaceae bacterium]MBL1128434.1 thiamine diphosphokinase [Chloroflexota bacterium]NOG34511.1 thiamine diphosphokinase [Chloroflexota bacterium]GIK58883.1 MAG: thiamine pyrophosphokinase [Chloroflexota bacterium]
MSVLIFANGEINEVEWIRPYLETATAVIAADGGTRHLLRLNHPPDIVIGDMDSLPDEVRPWPAAVHTRLLVYPPVKDETDLELALLYAAENYADPLLIFGALGGRLDQTIANILLLAHPGLHGRAVYLVTLYERAWLVRDHTEIHGQMGDLVSFIPLGGDAHVASTTGLQWPLQDDVLAFGLARGVSNVLTPAPSAAGAAVTATITLHSGLLLCIHTKSSSS